MRRTAPRSLSIAPCAARPLLAVVLAAAAGLAQGQVVTPPPPERPADEYTPQPEPVRPAQPSRRDQATGQASGQAAAQAQGQTQPAFDPSTVDFEPVYTVNDDGTITKPDEPGEIAAMKNNPLIPEDLWPVLEVLLEEREADFNLRIANNPRQAVRIAAGEADRIDVTDNASLAEVANLAGAFDPKGGPITYLANQGVLTEQMAAMSRYIWRDYNNAMNMMFVRKTADSTDRNEMLNMQARFLFGEGLTEAYAAFDRMAREALKTMDTSEARAALEKTGVEFRRAAAEILEPMSDQQLTDLFAEAIRRL